MVSESPIVEPAKHPARQTSASYGALARRVGGWTTNLLATAIILVGGLAMGWQVLAWWRDEAGASDQKELAAQLDNLPLMAEGREFRTKNGPLKVERVHGDAAQAARAMREFCRGVPAATSEGTAGPGETKFVAQLRQQTPLEEAGDLSLYQPPGQRAMVVAVGRTSGRIIGWSFALPAEEGVWTLYHFRPMAAGTRGAERIAGASR
jgi:hypothetical protein